MIDRDFQNKLAQALENSPATVLTGPRQVGKTTLALSVAETRACVYLDLERPSDLAKLTDIEAYASLNANKLIILDEVQRRPDLFAPLRSIIDERRRAGQRSGQFLLLGSASLDLLKQSSESLAGRVSYIELPPLTPLELAEDQMFDLWVRGGFPESILARSAKQSLMWRQDFIRTYLERDIPQLGPRIPAETLRRFWTMLAHNQGELFKAASLARGLDVKGITVSRYLDLMVDLLLVRRLQPWTSNLGRRLVKAPKVYVRDSGLCHALLGLSSMDDLLGHPVVGGSYEGFVIENILAYAPEGAQAGYYRTTGGAEIDLVLQLDANTLWAIEIKRSSAPSVSKGFYSACADLQPNRRFVVYGGSEPYPMGDGIEAISLHDMIRLVKAQA